MKKILNVESFESFQVSKKSMSQISGSRTVEFHKVEGTDAATAGGCGKFIDYNNGDIYKYKIKKRYEGKC